MAMAQKNSNFKNELKLKPSPIFEKRNQNQTKIGPFSKCYELEPNVPPITEELTNISQNHLESNNFLIIVECKKAIQLLL
jgi:hypothetical protein